MTFHSKCLFVIPLIALAPTIYTTHADVQRDDHQSIVSQLQGTDPAERRNAVAALQKLGPNLDRSLRVALFTTLQTEARKHSQRYYAAKRGETLPEMEDPEFIFELIRTAIPLRDPQSVPGLIEALGKGALVTNALADFGEQAAPAVLAVVTSTASVPAAIDSGLIALRFMIEDRQIRPLSPGTIAQIRAGARQRLTGEQPFVATIWRAIDLAMALQDPELTKIVQSIADSPFEVRSRGIVDPQLVEQTQKWASDRLAGLPARPTRLVTSR